MNSARMFQTPWGNICAEPGRPDPQGATVESDGSINFAMFSAYAERCWLVLFEHGAAQPAVEIELLHSVGHLFTVRVHGVEASAFTYGFRVDGPHQPRQGHMFDRRHVLLDPYARQVAGLNEWGHRPRHGRRFEYRAGIPTEPFDWEGDRPLGLPFADLIIYEMHVRSFTRHPSSGVTHPGTYDGLIEKIPYLQKLGINCVELMPIHEFDEFENSFINPLTGQKLKQYWGYGTIGFFAPKAGFAATGREGGQVNEFKRMVKALHDAGIEVMLDVVFNHTGEGGHGGHTISFRGIDNKTYYMLTANGEYYNFTGTGNTVNCNHPVVRRMIVDCLRYWVTEYHIDGFRFDLASIMVRDQKGHPLVNPPLVEEIARDPVLADTKIVAEAWDAAGLYQVGSFPHYGRWSEWNGKYRDTIRKFMKGADGQVGAVVQRVLGSPDLYWARGPISSVNFVNCHDGFTLADTVAYNHKHNEANGEGNRDGANDNNSWNCGVEGPTDDPTIKWLRRRLMRSAMVMLFTSQGIPLFHMGDEMAHTKRGNNNTYGHDNDLNWLDWTRVEEHADLYRFFQQMIAFRKRHGILRRRKFFSGTDTAEDGYPDISWHGIKVWQPDWGHHSHTVAYLLNGRTDDTPTAPGEFIYVALNMHWKTHVFDLPDLPDGVRWHRFADTGRRPPYDICEPGAEHELINQKSYVTEQRSAVILVGR